MPPAPTRPGPDPRPPVRKIALAPWRDPVPTVPHDRHAPRISVAHKGTGARLHAPAAERNAGALLDLLKTHAPASGTALELASGTGQHVTHFATHLPGLTWQPTDITDDRLASIAAWSADAPQGAILPPLALDATRAGWSGTHNGFALVLLVNLLHLVSTQAARTLIAEAGQALAPQGRFHHLRPLPARWPGYI